VTPPRPCGNRRWRARGTLLVALVAVHSLVLLAPDPAHAARYTPAAWRQEVADTIGAFEGQRKNTTWIRDRDRNFIDDMIERQFQPGDSVDVIVDLNDSYARTRIERTFSAFGRIVYFGKLVSCLYLESVPFDRLNSLAHVPEVAMIEWQTPFTPIMGVGVRSVQAAESGVYPGAFVRKFDTVTGVWSGMTGKGVNIAIIDTGVQNDNPALPGTATTAAGRVVAGFDATDPADVGDGTTDPDATEPLLEHGTRVASIALGRIPSGVDCGTASDDSNPPDCAGVAPEAGLVDVKVWDWDSTVGAAFEDDGDIMRGIDWVGENKAVWTIGVANISLSNGIDCDGLCAVCEAVNYLAAIGIVPVVGIGNAVNAADKGSRRVGTPAAASYAITVGGTDDGDTIARTGDIEWSGSLIGPRLTSTGGDSGPLGQKPDLSAPAEDIRSLDFSDTYSLDSGTSYAAPFVAGAAAVLLQANPLLDPANMKDLLRRTADDQENAGGLGSWDPKFGRGFLNLYEAHRVLMEERPTDLRFVSCSGVSATAGAPCPLAAGMPSWLNTIDLTTDPDPPVKGVATTIKAAITNDGTSDAAKFMVTFGYYEFGTGTALFHEIETKTVELLTSNTDTEISCAWTPLEDGHQCLQVTIHYGLDAQYGNNTTQRNLTVAASQYDVRIENPYMAPARFSVRAESEREDWPCTVDTAQFAVGGPEDTPKTIHVGFRAPRHARVGARANCNVSVYARPAGSRDSTLIGGVTVQTYVPRACHFTGQVLDRDGHPVRGAKVTFSRDLPPGVIRAPWERDRRTTTNREGRFELDLFPDAHQTLRVVVRGIGDWRAPITPRCAVPNLRLQLWKDGIRLLR